MHIRLPAPPAAITHRTRPAADCLRHARRLPGGETRFMTSEPIGPRPATV